MTNSWQTFWKTYRNIEARTEEDLFFQVGKTVNKQPVPREVLMRLVERNVNQLRLSPEDHLLDLCCGNGLVSYELAAHVGRLTGVDFAEHLIYAARRMKFRENITYFVGDVTAPLALLIGETTFPSKFLMSDALANFEPTQFDIILSNIKRHLAGRAFRFLLTEIPNFYLKYNFYNTPERVARHIENEKHPGNTNDGLGRWWRPEEIEEIVSRLGLQSQITNQPLDIYNYRMEVLITSAS